MCPSRGLIRCRSVDDSGGGVDAQLAELAVERRPADSEATGDLRHPAAVMADREPDNVGFDLLERTEMAVAGEQGHDRSAGDGFVAARLADVGREVGAPPGKARLHRDVREML